MRDMVITEAASQNLFCEVLECHRQIWSNQSAWDGYANNPRFSDGLMLVCSPICVEFCIADGMVLTAGQGDIIYAPEGSLYRVKFKNGGGDPDLFTVNFRLKSSDGEAVRLSDSICRLGESTPEIRLLVDELYTLFLYSERNAWHRQAKFLGVLAAVAETADSRKSEYSKIAAGVRLIRCEWDQNHHIERYAFVCGMSVSGFYRYFKEWSGLSPNEYRIRMRMMAARSMLQNSTLGVQEVAFRVGFTDPYYFSRCFCKLMGVSPRSFRKNAKAL